MYEELLLNSTFVFYPGGGGTSSYRFAESLEAGAIPVVTSDVLPPFPPEIDWSGCIVKVSEARVVGIPDLVRTISDKVQERQWHCAQLHQKVFGDKSEMQQFVVAIRIKGALMQKIGVS